jgi:hypothetical protein
MSEKDKNTVDLDELFNDPLVVDPFTISVADDNNFDWDSMGTITLSNTSDSSIILGPYGPLSDTITFDDTVWTSKQSIQIGNTTITEDTVKNLEALVETIQNLPEDNEFRTMFESILILKKLKNEN